jgi:hypothetical protein
VSVVYVLGASEMSGRVCSTGILGGIQYLCLCPRNEFVFYYSYRIANLTIQQEQSYCFPSLLLNDQKSIVASYLKMVYVNIYLITLISRRSSMTQRSMRSARDRGS